MKKTLFIIVMLLAVTLCQAQRTYVYCVGISDYPGTENDLPMTAPTAKKIAKLFKEHYQDVSLTTSSYATYSEITGALRRIARQAKAGDRIIFFYSGHGYPGGLVAYDNNIPYDVLIDIFKDCKADMKLMLIEACHSGSVAGGNSGSLSWSELARDPSMVFLMSSKADEYSLGDRLMSFGMMGNALEKGLRGLGDSDKNREITVEELFRYIYSDVMLHSQKQQHPQLIASKSMYPMVVLSW